MNKIWKDVQQFRAGKFFICIFFYFISFIGLDVHLLKKQIYYQQLINYVDATVHMKWINSASNYQALFKLHYLTT